MGLSPLPSFNSPYQEARVFAALAELLAVRVVDAAGEDAARGQRVAAPARGRGGRGHADGRHHGQHARQPIHGEEAQPGRSS